MVPIAKLNGCVSKIAAARLFFKTLSLQFYPAHEPSLGIIRVIEEAGPVSRAHRALDDARLELRRPGRINEVLRRM